MKQDGFILVTTTYDPISRHPSFTQEHIDDLCGFLQPWSQEALSDYTTLEEVKEAIASQRGYPHIESKESTIDADGRHHYPDDPDMFPVMHIRSEFVEIFIYEYAIIVFRDTKSKEFFCTRMD